MKYTAKFVIIEFSYIGQLILWGKRLNSCYLKIGICTQLNDSLKKALSSPHNQLTRVITLDKNPAYPPALQELMNEKALPKETLNRQTKYLNNIVQDDNKRAARK